MTRRGHRFIRGNDRGTALVEFAFALPVLLVMFLLAIEFGLLLQCRLIITNVSREGGSLGSRDPVLDNSLTSLLVSSGRPLHLEGPRGKIYVTRITAGLTKADPWPKITTRLTQGGFGSASRFQSKANRLGLSKTIYDHLVYKDANATADIPEITIVEVFYDYKPVTPMLNLKGMVLSSTAIF